MRAAAARGLEQGAFRWPAASGLSAVWSHAARVERPVELPPGTPVVGVGGPTLGGSFKTPFALSVAAALARQGARVAVAAHGFGARVSEPSQVEPRATAREVGDEALWLARELSSVGVPVFTGRNRTAVLARAAKEAQLVIADSLLQASPERLALSILVVDAGAPWGAGKCPPLGDLRAPRERLLGAKDLVVAVSDRTDVALPPDLQGLPAVRATSRVSGACLTSGVVVSMADLARMRVGLVLAIARPERVLRMLSAHGVTPSAVHVFGDHQVPRAPMREVPHIDGWLTTGKCATKLGSHYAGAPVLVLDHRVEAPDEVLREIARRL